MRSVFGDELEAVDNIVDCGGTLLWDRSCHDQLTNWKYPLWRMARRFNKNNIAEHVLEYINVTTTL